MKKITLLSLLSLSVGLVACGGGDPESASDKPNTLFPEGYVPPSSASSSSSSSTGGIVNQAIPFHENFDAATNTRQFFTTAYKTLNTDASLPFYFATGGFLDEFGNPSPTTDSWITGDANRKIRIGNGRFTLGQTRLENKTTTADATIPTWGEFDLSKPYKVSFCVVESSGGGNFEIFVDNNDTTGNNSRYGAGNASRIFQKQAATLVAGQRVEVSVPVNDKQIGTSTSFFQFRVSSGGWAVIDDLVVEYAGEPHGFTLPACVAEESIAPAPEVPPGVPVVTLIAGDAEIVVSWSSTGIDTTYDVVYNTVNDVTSATVFSGNPVTGTNAQLTGLVNGQEYFVWVKATNAIGSSEYSEPVSATPVAPSGTDESKEWGFNSFEYSALFGGATSGAVQVTVRDTPYEADGLNIFLNNGSALRYRFDSNVWNYNGNSFRSSDSRVPAIGEVVPELRAYVGVPVVEARAATITFTLKQTGSGQTGKAVIVDQDNKVVSVIDLPYIASVPENPEAANVAFPVTLAEGHSTSELRLFYSREGAGSGGADLIKLLKNYADSPLEPSSSSSSAASSSVPASSSSSSSSEASSSVAPSSSSVASSESSSSSSVDGGVTSSEASSSSSAATGTWNAQVLNLVGASEVAANGSLSVNETASVTLTAEGGKLDSANHNLFFASQQIAKSDFVFTARIASVTGATAASTNAYRFGLMVMSDVNVAATYADLAPWADVGFYVNATPALVGSRANSKTDGSRTRSDITGLAVGDYVRIEVYDDGALKRVKRYTSTDGVTFTQANSTTDFKATSSTDNWFVGLYAAPGVNNLTVQFDNITIEDYVAPVL